MHYFRLMGARVQRIDEGVQYYYADLAALAKKAFPRLTMDDRNWIVAQKFVDGLSNKAIQDRLAFEEIDGMSLEEILKTAEKMENGARKAVTLQPAQGPAMNAQAMPPVPYFAPQSPPPDACSNGGEGI